jgi:hypothetical protein
VEAFFLTALTAVLILFEEATLFTFGILTLNFPGFNCGTTTSYALLPYSALVF